MQVGVNVLHPLWLPLGTQGTWSLVNHLVLVFRKEVAVPELGTYYSCHLASFYQYIEYHNL